MEHSSHVADVTKTGTDVIHHEEHLLSNIDFILSTFAIRVITGLPAGKPTWCLTLQESLYCKSRRFLSYYLRVYQQ